MGGWFSEAVDKLLLAGIGACTGAALDVLLLQNAPTSAVSRFFGDCNICKGSVECLWSWGATLGLVS